MKPIVNTKAVVVAVDGTAGSGKSSICSTVCKKKKWVYLNTGSIYRAIAYLVLQHKMDPTDESKVCDLMTDLLPSLRWDYATETIFFGKKALTPYLYSEQVGQTASLIAKYPGFRQSLLPMQRQLINNCDASVVMVDGRDIASVVIPSAPIKIFMSASIKERAIRRQKQLKEKLAHETVPSIEALMEDIKKRDGQDSTRDAAPLMQSEEAILFDTSDKSFEDCVDDVISLIESYLR